MLVTYIVLWSACTALTGFATGLAALVIVRVARAASRKPARIRQARLLISRWFPFSQRGTRQRRGFVRRPDRQLTRPVAHCWCDRGARLMAARVVDLWRLGLLLALATMAGFQ